jgi:hypothetical protein
MSCIFRRLFEARWFAFQTQEDLLARTVDCGLSQLALLVE